MARKGIAKPTIRKKLTLNKETIRDLTPRKKQADGIRAGAQTASYVVDCGATSIMVRCKP